MNKLTFLFFSALVFPLTMIAQTWDDAKYKAIEASIVAPTFADAEFDITATGITTASTPNEIQTAINATIDKCSEAGGGKVIIPPGTWKTGAITLKSNVNLVVKAGATLLFAYDPYLYPLVKTRWEGLDIMNYSPCIYAYQAKNVAITGDGIIDGNGTKDTWWKWCGAAKYGYDANTLQSQSNEYAGKNTQYKQVDADGNLRCIFHLPDDLFVSQRARGIFTLWKNKLLPQKRQYVRVIFIAGKISLEVPPVHRKDLRMIHFTFRKNRRFSGQPAECLCRQR